MVGLGVALVLVYFLAINKTVATRAHVLEMQNLQSQSENQPQSTVMLQYQLNKLQMSLSAYADSSGKAQDKLLKTISMYTASKNILLKSYEPPKTNGEINTTIVYLQGNFLSLLKVLQELENTSGLGRIVHSSFESSIDYNTRKKILTIKVVIQTVV